MDFILEVFRRFKRFIVTNSYEDDFNQLSFKNSQLIQLTTTLQEKIEQLEQQVLNVKYKTTQYGYNNITNNLKLKLKNNQKINVVFFVHHSSVWVYDDLYKIYQKNPQYNLSIVIAPYTMYGKRTMIDDMNGSYNYFKQKKYQVIKSYDEKTDKFIDVKKTLQPDIIFFTNPYKITTDDFYINNYCDDCLTCYVPYGINAANLQQSQFNQPFHNLMWKNFYETNLHSEMSKVYADNKGSNVIVTGYPKCDVFLDKKYKVTNVWKKTTKKLKKIIWAPHHTIEDNNQELAYSNFLTYYQIMLEIAKKFENEIQFTFKPHPLLLTKLKLHPSWGEKKVKEYCQKWKNGKNTQLELDNYIDLFLSSDGMIMDSISFISEYLFVNKPVLFMVRDDTIQHKFNEYGLLAYDLLYKSYNKKDITNFIKTVILKKVDNKKSSREKFLMTYLIPPNNLSASENIYYTIHNTLK